MGNKHCFDCGSAEEDEQEVP